MLQEIVLKLIVIILEGGLFPLISYPLLVRCVYLLLEFVLDQLLTRHFVVNPPISLIVPQIKLLHQVINHHDYVSS